MLCVSDGGVVQGDGHRQEWFWFWWSQSCTVVSYCYISLYLRWCWLGSLTEICLSYNLCSVYSVQRLHSSKTNQNTHFIVFEHYSWSKTSIIFPLWNTRSMAHCCAIALKLYRIINNTVFGNHRAPGLPVCSPAGWSDSGRSLGQTASSSSSMLDCSWWWQSWSSKVGFIIEQSAISCRTTWRTVGWYLLKSVF